MNSHVAVFSDTSCLDVLNTAQDCLFLLKPILSYLSTGWIDPTVFPKESILPHDYDNHIEVSAKLKQLNSPRIGSDRLLHLLCVESEDKTILEYSGYAHNTTSFKLKTWSDDPSFDLNVAGFVQVLLIITALFVLY
jgi:hypothetical protein